MVPTTVPWTIAPGGRPPTAYMDRAGTWAVDWVLINDDTANHGPIDVAHHDLTMDHRAVDMTHNGPVVVVPAVSMPPTCFSGSRIGDSADHQES